MSDIARMMEEVRRLQAMITDGGYCYGCGVALTARHADDCPVHPPKAEEEVPPEPEVEPEEFEEEEDPVTRTKVKRRKRR